MAAITNYHKLSNRSLFSHSSGGQESKIGIAGRKSRCWQGHRAPRGGSGEESAPCVPEGLSDGCQHSLDVAISIQSSRTALPVSLSVPVFVWPFPPHEAPICLLPLTELRAPLDNPGSSPYLKVPNLIPSAKACFAR